MKIEMRPRNFFVSKFLQPYIDEIDKSSNLFYGKLEWGLQNYLLFISSSRILLLNEQNEVKLTIIYQTFSFSKKP